MRLPLTGSIPQLRWLLPGLIVTALVAAAATVGPGLVDGWVQWVVELQRALHRQLAGAVHAVRDAGPAAAWPLVALSFLYGVFHAAGPGHGKVVVATYVATHESRLAHALALTAAASLAQGLTAIVAVHVAVHLLGLTLREARGTSGDLELMSFALVACLGAFLACRAGVSLLRTPAPGCRECHGHHHHAQPAPAGIWASLGVVASIGLRPCAGALVILLLAHAGGLPTVGALAVLAMAAGTALTTSTLAALAVFARRTALAVAHALPDADRRRQRWLDVIALTGGLILALVGALLFQAAWSAPAHPFR